MDAMEILKKALLAGVGAQEKIKELADELVNKGQLSESQGARLIKEWADKAHKGSDEVEKAFSEMMDKAMMKLSFPSHKDIETLRAEMKLLSQRLDKLEGRG